jgi:hypothetical protein
LGHVWIKATPTTPDDGQDGQIKWINLILPGCMNNLAGFAIRASRRWGSGSRHEHFPA